MKVLIVHQHFKTPEEGGGIRSYYIAKFLSEKGHQVTILSGHNSKKGITQIGGFDIHYFKIPYDNKLAFSKRIVAFIFFSFHCCFYLFKSRKFDLLYTISTPLTTGLVGLFAKKVLNISYLFEIGDLWPEVPIKMGIIKKPWLQKILYDFEKKIYQQAKLIVALSDPIRDYVLKNSSSKQVITVTNFSDCDFFEAKYRELKISNENPLRVCYAGTFGVANGLDFLILLIQECEKQKLPVEFYLMGDGASYDKIKTDLDDKSPVYFYPWGNTKQVKNLLERCDAVLLSFLNLPILHTGSPNKFFDGLAAGKIIISNLHGWISDVIKESGCGFSFDAQSSNDFIGKVKNYTENSSLLVKHQQNARALAISEYELKKNLNRLVEKIECVYGEDY